MTPALLTNTSILPNSFTTFATKSRTGASNETSQLQPLHSFLRARISLTVCSSSEPVREQSANFAPSRAYAIAIALPMPLPAPVIKATLSWSIILFPHPVHFELLHSFPGETKCSGSQGIAQAVQKY